MRYVLFLFLSAALPVRIWVSVGPFRSFSIFDIAILACSLLLVVRLLLNRKIDFGDQWVFFWLSVPLALCALSFLWSESPTETIRTISVYAEALIAYLTVTTYLSGKSTDSILSIVVVFACVLLATSLFMILGVPGFSPQIAENSYADDLVSYYARLSHPFLGRSNNLAGVLALLLFPLVSIAWARRRIALKALAVLVGLGLVLTLSRGVILAIVMVTFIRTLGSAKLLARLFAWLAALVPTITLATVWLITAYPLAAVYLTDRLTTENVLARAQLFEAASQDIAEHPLLGAGAGAIEVSDLRLREGAHNSYIEQILSFGVPLGVVCGFSIIAVVVRVRQLAFNSTDEAMTGLWLAPACQLLIILSETAFEGSILKIIYYMMIAWTVAMIRSSKECSFDSAETLGLIAA